MRILLSNDDVMNAPDLIVLEAIANGFMSLTPLQLDLAHDASSAPMRARYA